MPPEDNILLNVRGLSKHFGGIKAVEEVTLSIEKRSIISMIGPNGAGKSTFINVVSGIYTPDAGKVYFQGEDITGVPAHEIAAKGIARTFQLEELFGSLSVLENVMVGCHTKSRSDLLACGFSLPSARSEEKRVRDEAMECLKEVGLEQRAHDPISRLPLGERKLVGIAIALGMKPKLLMLDEPAGGRAAHEVERLGHLIYALRDQGITLFIVEHNMPFVMSLSERVIVLDQGCKIAEGTPDEVRTSEKVIKAYLGEEEVMVKTEPDATICKVAGERSGKKRLGVEGVSTFYGEAQALKDVSLEVRAHEVVAILGSNGAGKTTILRTITGLLAPHSGKILFDNEQIGGRPAHEIVKKGIVSVPEGRQLFGSMTVWDNLLMGTYSLSKTERKEVVGKRLEMIYSLFPILKERLMQRAETMSGGQQQMLTVARALMANTRLLALDEPSLGLSPLLVSEMMQALKRICSEMGVSLLLVEQNARAALKIADFAYVLERGQVVFSGRCEEVISSAAIQSAYLGG